MKASTQTLQPETRTVSASKFKATCLQLMDEMNEKKFTLSVTKRGKVVMVAKAPDSEGRPFVSIVGSMPGIQILGDIISPLPQEWTLPEWAWEKPEVAPKQKKKKKK